METSDFGASQTAVLENPATATGNASDRRRSRRQSFVGNAWLSPEAGTRGHNHHIVVGDLSLHGIGFSSDERLDPQAVHWMVLDSGGLRASARVRIATCRPNSTGNGTYECGAEFF
ncbi:MAG: PilZ domain-containing protein [Tepidisphaeraceae bacterium]